MLVQQGKLHKAPAKQCWSFSPRPLKGACRVHPRGLGLPASVQALAARTAGLSFCMQGTSSEAECQLAGPHAPPHA